MTTAYWSVFIIIIIAYTLALIARIPGLTLEKNLTPRLASEEYSGFKQRTYWAHLNAMEAIAPFTAVIIIAHLVAAPQNTIDNLAMIFVGLRIVHAGCYMANLGTMRTLVFITSMVCMASIVASGL